MQAAWGQIVLRPGGLEARAKVQIRVQQLRGTWTKLYTYTHDTRGQGPGNLRCNLQAGKDNLKNLGKKLMQRSSWNTRSNQNGGKNTIVKWCWREKLLKLGGYHK